MNEKQFIDFLTRIHNEFYKNSLKGSKKYLGDIILTFLFFKYLEERVQLQGNVERYNDGSVKLWSEWVTKSQLISNKDDDLEKMGKKIKTCIDNQIKLLNNKDDEIDENTKEYVDGYEKEYREFSSVLTNVSNIPQNKYGYKFLAKIYKELEGINTANNKKEKSLYLHACNFDVYGSIYEKFKDKDEKEELGQYYTKRHISKVLAQITLKTYINKIKKEINDLENQLKETGDKITTQQIIDIIIKNYKNIKIIDPSCGTGGLLTECYAYLEEEYKKILNGKHDYIEEILSKQMFTGLDIEEDCIKKAKLNMFFAGDGHTALFRANSLEPIPNQKIHLDNDCINNKWNIFISNPPYGRGKEYLFIKKYIDCLPYNGRIGIIIPNGVLENPSKDKFRKYLISNLKIESIISLNKYVFAPYTKQKTYILVGYKRSKNTIESINKQFIEINTNELDYNKVNVNFNSIKDKIWSYILDFDGYNLSDNRWETDLVTVENGIPRYIHNDTYEVVDKYLNGEIIKTNQLDIDGSIMGKKIKEDIYELCKASFICVNEDITEDNYFNLLPELYMRPYEPEYITEKELDNQIKNIEILINDLALNKS